MAGCGATDHDSGIDRSFFGVNAQSVLIQLNGGDVAGATRQVEGIAETGVDFVRANADWVSLEPAPPVGNTRTYDFAKSDVWVSLLARNDLRWQITGIGATTPEWNRDPATAAECAERTPATPDSMAALMAALAARYGEAGSFWSEHPDVPRYEVTAFEVWNEPNFSPFWCPAPDPVAYAEMFQATEKAVSKADPGANVVFGGLAGFIDPISADVPGRAMSVENFMRQAIAAKPELFEAIDQIGLHIYGPDAGSMLGSLAGLRGQLLALGLDAPIALNEIGWPTSGGAPTLPEALRAAALNAVTEEIASLDCGVIAYAPHTWTTPEVDPAEREHWFGLADPQTGDLYPTALAYADAVSRLIEEAPDTVSPCPTP